MDKSIVFYQICIFVTKTVFYIKKYDNNSLSTYSTLSQIKVSLTYKEYSSFIFHIIYQRTSTIYSRNLTFMASKTRNLFTNAISLTLTALSVRAVSVIFNIYISNKAGGEAMGLFSLLGSVYAFSLTLGCASINLGTTRLVADALGMGDGRLALRSVKRALITCILSSLTVGALLFSLSTPISKNLLGDIRAASSLRILSTTLLPVAVCSCLTGYFTAVRRVKLNAAFQVIIQFIKIFVTVAFLYLFGNLDPESACIALVLGSAISEFLSLAMTFILYLCDKKKVININQPTSYDIYTESLTRKLLAITLPVTISACVRSGLSMFQHILIPHGLKSSGSSWAEALSSYGALHGMALPLLLFPSAFIAAFAGLLIPEVSECIVQNNGARLERTSYRALGLALIFSIGVSGIMLFYSQELGLLIYKNEEAAKYIRILAPLIPVMYIDGAVDAILKGSGHQVYSMNVNIADTLTACIFAIFLIPKIGIWGYIISIYATEILNTTLSLIKMMSISKIKVRIIHQIIMPILCVIGATNISKLILYFINIAMPDGLFLVFGILLTTALYIILLFMTRTIGGDEKEFLYAALLNEKKYNEKFKKA